jgi:hypothetical protein
MAAITLAERSVDVSEDGGGAGGQHLVRIRGVMNHIMVQLSFSPKDVQKRITKRCIVTQTSMRGAFMSEEGESVLTGRGS